MCAQTSQANPLFRSYQTGFEKCEPITAGATLATAIQIGNPVSFPKAVKALKATGGIVEQVSEAELANAAAAVDRFGFFNDPQTGVALAATMKLVRAGTIPKGSRIVVISTAHGLKFIDFKLRFHTGELSDSDSVLRNPCGLQSPQQSNDRRLHDVVRVIAGANAGEIAEHGAGDAPEAFD